MFVPRVSIVVALQTTSVIEEHGFIMSISYNGTRLATTGDTNSKIYVTSSMHDENESFGNLAKFHSS